MNGLDNKDNTTANVNAMEYNNKWANKYNNSSTSANFNTNIYSTSLATSTTAAVMLVAPVAMMNHSEHMTGCISVPSIDKFIILSCWVLMANVACLF